MYIKCFKKEADRIESASNSENAKSESVYEEVDSNKDFKLLTRQQQ